MLYFVEKTEITETLETDKEVDGTTCNACQNTLDVTHVKCPVCSCDGRTCCSVTEPDPADDAKTVRACSVSCMEKLLDEME